MAALSPSLALFALVWLAHPSEPGPAAGALAKARRALAAQAWDEAREHGSAATAASPDDPETWLVLGLAWFRGGHPPEARAAFLRAVELAPGSAVARFDLASAEFEDAAYDAAEKTYLEAAALDARLRPLCELDAGTAAEHAGRPGAAEQHLRTALAAASGNPETAPVAERARAALAALDKRRRQEGREKLRALAHQGKEALGAGRPEEATARYREALRLSDERSAEPADRAEIAYGLGHALLRQGDRAGARAAFAEAARLSPREADFAFMLGRVEFELAEPEADARARRALEQALALGLDDEDAALARSRLLEISARGERPSARLALDGRAGVGYDSNVAQSGILVTEPSAQALGSPGAGQAEVELDALWRALGGPRNGLALEYRFSQVGYLAQTLDPYSIQEHDLALSGFVSSRRRVTLEGDLESFVLFSGLDTFGPFQVGVGVGGRLTVREEAGFETRLRYEHTFKHALEPGYASLSGGRDDVGLAEVWHNARARISLGYLLRREDVGAQTVPVGALVFPQPPPVMIPPGAGYYIPYSYLSHEGSLSGSVWLSGPLRVGGSARLEHRDYGHASFLFNPQNPTTRFDRRLRSDDRASFEVSLVRPIDHRLDVEFAYTFVVNTSNIDNTDPATPLDYDDKNYTKQVAELLLGFSF